MFADAAQLFQLANSLIKFFCFIKDWKSRCGNFDSLVLMILKWFVKVSVGMLEILMMLPRILMSLNCLFHKSLEITFDMFQILILLPRNDEIKVWKSHSGWVSNFDDASSY